MCTEVPDPRTSSPNHAAPNQRNGDSPGQETAAFSRRVVLKAAAGVAALAASGVGLVPDRRTSPALAQEAGGTRATRFVPQEHGYTPADAARGEWVTVATDFPFWALGASWNLTVGLWTIIAVQLSEDGETWTDTIDVAASEERGGSDDVDGRLFTPLIFTNGARWFRYQTIDNQRRPGEVNGLSFVYIDPTDGPWEADIEPEPPAAPGMARLMNAETLAPPEIVTREQWGANESWRFDGGVEVSPPRYETVSHILIHHTETTNRPVDVPGAIRSIYYYHAVELGWGDIGYNYLVDHNGRIYQGRYGGQDVIGHHAYDFAAGSAGISTIGNFHSIAPSEAAMSAIVAICAWVARDLDPLGSSAFHTAPNLPTIASHRDATFATCPGNGLWNLLPQIRQWVAQTLDTNQLDTGLPAGIVPGDRVRVQTGTGESLNLRTTPAGTIIGSLQDGALAWVIDGPERLSEANWYRLQPQGQGTGWASAEYLIVAPPVDDPPSDEFPFGLNLQVVSSAYIRRGPSLSTGIVSTAPANAWAYVTQDAPRVADGYTWYAVTVSGYGMGWMAGANLQPAPVTIPANAAFQVGDTVEASQTVQMRPRPGVAQPVMTTAPVGTRFEVSQGPISVTGNVWYGVYAAGRGGSWMVESPLRLVGPPPPGRFEIGDAFRVTSATNLRSAASTAGSVLVTMAVGTTGTILGGPASANGYTWWNVRLASGTTGWCIENWLVETDGGTTPPPTGKFDLGDTVRVTERLNLRSAASTAGSVIVVLNIGVTGTVLGGPSTGSGYTWWRIQTSAGTGWAVEDWLVETDGGGTTPPPPSTKFTIGDAFHVTTTANLRSGVGTGNSVVSSLAVNEEGTITGGPEQANGIWWWQVSVGGSSGWVDETTLTVGSSPLPPEGRFAPGTIVSVTERANFRTGAGTTNSVITILAVGATGTVLGGPATASGYTWWQLQTSAGTGWIIDDVLVAGGTPPPSGGFSAGTVVRVTDMNVRLRSAASTSGTILAVLLTGHQLTVVSGPTTGSGYSWYRVTSASAGTGYIAADFIARL